MHECRVYDTRTMVEQAVAATSAVAAPPPGPGQLDARIPWVGRKLAETLRRVLEAVPGGPFRPHELARVLGLNRDISGRVLAATKTSDALLVPHVIPGPEPLRKLLRAARRRNVPAQLIEEAGAAVREFEVLIREEAGDRDALDAIISSLSPQARAKFELASKQTIFKGTSLLKGAMADLWLHTALVHPSAEDAKFNDVAHLYGTLGLRRVRPNIVVKFNYRQFGVPTERWRTLDGRSPQESAGTELDQFCTLPAAQLDVIEAGNGTIYALAGNTVGPQSAADKLLGEVRPRAMARYAAPRRRNRKSLFVAPSVPVKLLVFDALLHEDVYSGSDPTLLVYDTAIDGMASVNDPARDADRLDVRESIVVLGRDVEAFQLAEMPRYGEMLHYACAKLGWNLSEFRGYRCSVQYPMYGCQACMVFEAPPPPI
jgi:hypothetical protein